MKILLKNAFVVNVFTDELERKDVLLEDERIIGVDDYAETEADITEDMQGKFICPGFIDAHMHIESSMLTPAEFAKACLPHGTTSIIADPHEIANVAGEAGISYMLEVSEGLPLGVYIMLPSCVPATEFDENGARLESRHLLPFYEHPRVLGLGEMMNYPGVIAGDKDVLAKIEKTHACGKIVNGHAPLMSGIELDKYIAAGIRDDHECSSAEEGKERIRKGQWVMLREGTAAHNLQDLLPLFDEPYNRRCMLVTDDRHPADLINEGEIDNIIRQAVKMGKSPLTGIRMASLQAAEYFGLRDLGAVAPGYLADLLILEDINEVKVCSVFKNGKKVVEKGKLIPFEEPSLSAEIRNIVLNSFHLNELTAQDFYIRPQGSSCRVIRVIPQQLLTEEWITELDFAHENGISIERDILKIAVIERHKNTGHMGLGFVNGLGLKKGAIASSVAHDSHNLIVIGTNAADMAAAANAVREMGGGNAVAADGRLLAKTPLPIAGLMSTLSAYKVAEQNEAVRCAVHSLGADDRIEPFMNMSFISLPVIPSLKITSKGLVQVESQKIVPLFV